jgi:hypothetical protein
LLNPWKLWIQLQNLNGQVGKAQRPWASS